MSETKPVIGITGPVKGGGSAWWFAAFAVWLQGGKPLRIYPGNPPEDVAIDGLILGGGADINPKRYGALLQEKGEEDTPSKGVRARIIQIISIVFYPVLFLIRNIFSAKTTVSGSDIERDELEFNLLNAAYDRGIPILGICRGAQLINVKFDGTLLQDISGFYTEVPKVDTIWPRKSVVVKEDTQLSKITGAQKLSVNALHNQAVDHLGDSLKISAQEENGIIQGIEHVRCSYLIGVQWHPEYMPQIPLQRAIFRTLVEKAAKKKSNKG